MNFFSQFMAGLYSLQSSRFKQLAKKFCLIQPSVVKETNDPQNSLHGYGIFFEIEILFGEEIISFTRVETKLRLELGQ